MKSKDEKEIVDMEIITSTSNSGVKMVKTLLAKARARKQNNCFVAEGSRMVLETPEELLQEIYVSQSYLEKIQSDEIGNESNIFGKFQNKIHVVSDGVMKDMSDTQTPQGILAVIRCPEYDMNDLMDASGEKTFLLVLENVQDPGNLGTMFRTAEGAGATGIIMSKDTVDIYNPKTVRSTMGSLYRMPFVIVDNLCDEVEKLKSKGVKFYAAHLRGKDDYDRFDYTGSTGFFIGNEGNGLTDELSHLSDEYVKIPMSGEIESLNAAMAAGILMYETNRQRRI